MFEGVKDLSRKAPMQVKDAATHRKAGHSSVGLSLQAHQVPTSKVLCTVGRARAGGRTHKRPCGQGEHHVEHPVGHLLYEVRFVPLP